MDYPGFNFEITSQAEGSRARRGLLTTPHGTIETPNFIFCGTKASVKNLSPEQLKAAGAEIMLSNTYHLLIQPGPDVMENVGGLHRFSGWDGPMLTDSGGFQVFSLGKGVDAQEINGKNRFGKGRNPSLLSLSEEDGAVFRSYMSGEKMTLTPENAMQIQRKIGADLIMQLDECTAFSDTRDYTADSMRMSTRWGDRCLSQFERDHDGKQGLYGIVQGGVYEDLRIESAQWTKDRDFFGTAIGGCFGDTKEKLYEIVSWCTPVIHPGRPVHLLGIGGIDDIFEGVKLGIDTFDCVAPTRMARHGWAIMKGVERQRLNLRNAKYREDTSPLDETMDLPCSNKYSKAYIHHLMKAGELLGMQILAQHNVAMMMRLIHEIRQTLDEGGSLDALKKEWVVAVA